MKKRIAVLIAAAMLIGLTACSSQTAPSQSGQPSQPGSASVPPAGAVTQLSISTSGATGMYYTTIAPICDYINSSSTSIRIVPATSSGSTENLTNVLNGVSDLGCVYSNEVMSGHESNEHLRFVGPTTKVSPLQFVVKADSGITSIEDLAGKSVHLGAAGSGARLWSVQFLEWLGIYDKVTEVPLSNEECVSGMGDGVVSMITVAGLAPSARVTEAAATYDIAILDLTPYLDDYLAAYPYYKTYDIEPGIYDGVDATVTTFGLATSIVCMDDMPDDVLTEFMTWAYCEEAQTAALSSNPNGPDHNPEDPLANMSIPIHPAAKAFWESKGFTVPDL